MSHLLHIDSSVRGEASVSRRLTARAADRWRAAHPGGAVTYRDLGTGPIPHLDAATGPARMVPAEQRTPAQDASFALSAELIDEIKQADTVLLGLPLYNFAPPSTVKAWVDHIIATGLSIDAQTHTGLLGDTDFIVLASRDVRVRSGHAAPRLGSCPDLAATRVIGDRAAAALHHRRTHDGRSQPDDGPSQTACRRKPQQGPRRHRPALDGQRRRCLTR
jgi:FMN-dependent NADH-azoreductase